MALDYDKTIRDLLRIESRIAQHVTDDGANGASVKLGVVMGRLFSVDTADDIERMIALYRDGLSIASHYRPEIGTDKTKCYRVYCPLAKDSG